MRLVAGSGSEKTGACWMSALHYYTRRDKISWTDQPKCVAPSVRRLCIALNDICATDAEREALIGPVLFEPVGTDTGEEDEQKRAWLCADVACRWFASKALFIAGLVEEASKLEGLQPIVNKETAIVALAAATAAAGVARKAHSAYSASHAAAGAALAASRAAGGAAYSVAYAAARSAVYSGSWAAANAVSTARVGGLSATEEEKTEIKEKLLQLILDCCKIGSKKEVVPSKSKEQVLCFLNK